MLPMRQTGFKLKNSPWLERNKLSFTQHFTSLQKQTLEPPKSITAQTPSDVSSVETAPTTLNAEAFPWARPGETVKVDAWKGSVILPHRSHTLPSAILSPRNPAAMIGRVEKPTVLRTTDNCWF
jgi:hypothetical protein